MFFVSFGFVEKLDFESRMFRVNIINFVVEFVDGSIVFLVVVFFIIKFVVVVRDLLGLLRVGFVVDFFCGFGFGFGFGFIVIIKVGDGGGKIVCGEGVDNFVGGCLVVFVVLIRYGDGD